MTPSVFVQQLRIVHSDNSGERISLPPATPDTPSVRWLHPAAARLPDCKTMSMTQRLLSSAATATPRLINPINSRLHLNFHQFSILQLKLNIISKLSSSFCRLHHLVSDWIGLVWINLNYISSLFCISLTLSISHLILLNVIRFYFF